MTSINIMALRHSAFYSPLLMTIAGGFLQKHGLQAEYSVATPGKTVPGSIHNGSCHVAQSAVATSFAALERGEKIDIVHFAQINERDGFFIAAREPDADFNWHKLVGKTILVDHFFQPYAMFKYGLHLQGIDINDLDVIDAGTPAEMEQVFRRGDADYVHLQGPAPQQIKHDGLGFVVAAVGDAVGPVAFSSLCASREWLETDMASHFMAAYIEARATVIQAPAAVIARQLQAAGFFTDINGGVLAATIAAYQRLGCWPPEAAISRQSYEKLLDVFQYDGLIQQRYAYQAAVVSMPV